MAIDSTLKYQGTFKKLIRDFSGCFCIQNTKTLLPTFIVLPLGCFLRSF